MDTGKLGVWYFFDQLSAQDAAAQAKRIEALGYGTLWIPETVGRNPMVLASWLLANTSTLNLATGIVNIYHREPGVTMAGQNVKVDFGPLPEPPIPATRLRRASSGAGGAW